MHESMRFIRIQTATWDLWGRGQAWWYRSVLLGTGEDEAGASEVQGKPGKLSLSQEVKWGLEVLLNGGNLTQRA